MGSAILATEPGPNSGEMLFAYPSTSVSTDTQSEMMKVCFFCVCTWLMSLPEVRRRCADAWRGLSFFLGGAVRARRFI